VKWLAFSVVEQRIVEDCGDYVIMRDVMLPDPDGPILLRVDDEREPEWVAQEWALTKRESE
jgi:hypothetical protein